MAEKMVEVLLKTSMRFTIVISEAQTRLGAVKYSSWRRTLMECLKWTNSCDQAEDQAARHQSFTAASRAQNLAFYHLVCGQSNILYMSYYSNEEAELINDNKTSFTVKKKKKNPINTPNCFEKSWFGCRVQVSLLHACNTLQVSRVARLTRRPREAVDGESGSWEEQEGLRGLTGALLDVLYSLGQLSCHGFAPWPNGTWAPCCRPRVPSGAFILAVLHCYPLSLALL